MKKFILIALAFIGLSATASTFGIKPIVNQPSCNGANTGDINLVVTGGTAPFTYAWSNSLPATSSQTGLTAGSYSVTVTDNLGATTTYTIVMSEPSALNLSTSATNVSTHGGSDGCIHLNSYGGTPDYSYEWSNGATVQNPCGLTAGTYIVTVTDAFGCMGVTSKTITQPSQVLQTHHINLGNMSHVDGSQASHGEVRDLSNDSDNSELTSADVSLYPNPTSSALTVKTGTNNNAQISIINATGQLVMTTTSNSSETKMDLTTLAKGEYVVTVKTATGVVNKMITVIK